MCIHMVYIIVKYYGNSGRISMISVGYRICIVIILLIQYML